MDEKFAIDLEHVTRIYKRDEFEVRALDDVTVQIPAGRFVAIMGPSGSGKTTMLNLIAGIDHASTRTGRGRRRGNNRDEGARPGGLARAAYRAGVPVLQSDSRC